MTNNNSSREEIVSQALEDMKREKGDSFRLEDVNLAELERVTGLSRSVLRRFKKNGFKDTPNGNKGRKHQLTVLSPFIDEINNMMMSNITNSEVIFTCLKKHGYQGSLTTIKNYIQEHKDLVPALRQIVSPQGNRGRRYETGPGESYQMDWGFVNVSNGIDSNYKCACFAMVCHHCGKMYIEFFPNAKQENLFIGMIHAFIYLGVPKYVLTDNMKSVVIGRDDNKFPIWQKDYEVFMKAIGFSTKLCKPRHPFTKGKVERLVKYVKQNFIVGKVFGTLTDLNIQALRWCDTHNNEYHRSSDCIPQEKHENECMKVADLLSLDNETKLYLAPIRKISFDGFVNYEGRRFGVPYWYTKKTCRVHRDGYYLHIYDIDMERELAMHNVTWSRKDEFCEDQYMNNQPEEYPSAPVKVSMTQKDFEVPAIGFDKFDFFKKVKWDE